MSEQHAAGQHVRDEEAATAVEALIHGAHPDLIFCLSSNGLNLHDHIDRLAELGVNHITLTINAVDPLIGAKIYAWVRHKRRVLRGVEAAQELLDEQLRCIPKLKAATAASACARCRSRAAATTAGARWPRSCATAAREHQGRRSTSDLRLSIFNSEHRKATR